MYTYSNYCEEVTVDEPRKYLFTQKIRLLENLPPTQNALKQHILRAAYQGNVWEQMLNKIQISADAGTMRMEACK